MLSDKSAFAVHFPLLFCIHSQVSAPTEMESFLIVFD